MTSAVSRKLDKGNDPVLVFLKSLFWMWTIFRVFIKSITKLLLFYVLIFWQEAVGP